MPEIKCQECGAALKFPEQCAARAIRCKCNAVTPLPSKTAPAQPPPAAVSEDDAPKPKKKRKKKKRPKAAASSVPWLWIAGVSIAFIAALAIYFIAQHESLRGILIELAIMVPVSTVILVISMLASSHFAGGIDFGDARIAILKAALLIVIVNLVRLLPFGGMLTFPIWLIGLTQLFGLDLWETRVLFSINWIMNLALSWLIFGFMMSHHADEVNPLEAGAALIDIQRLADLGAKVRTDDTDQTRVLGVDLSGTQAADADLPCLRHFDDLQTLDLSGTPVTDAGLVHLKRFKHLQTIKLRGARVTAAGVTDLKNALPRAKVEAD